MPARGHEFSQLVYQLLVVERKRTLDSVARDMELNYDALHARISGRTAFSADEIAKLIGILKDPRLVACILRYSNFVGIERVDGPLDDPEKEIVKATHRILLEAADVLEAVDIAFADDKIDHREARVIYHHVEIAERAMITLREHLRRYL